MPIRSVIISRVQLESYAREDPYVKQITAFFYEIIHSKLGIFLQGF